MKGESWTAKFFDRVVHRPDDGFEILSCHLAMHGRPIPNALKKGLGTALARFDEYQFAKYRKTRAELSLVDVVKLVHPPHTEVLRKLVSGALAPAETWECVARKRNSLPAAERSLHGGWSRKRNSPRLVLLRKAMPSLAN